MKDNKPKWLQEDDDMDLIEALEKDLAYMMLI